MHTLFLILPLVIILIIRLIINSNTNKSVEKKNEDFRAREYEANFTRSTDISNLELFIPEISSLPFGHHQNIASLTLLEETVKQSANEPMLDLHACTNTDIKLMYGVGNFPVISTYDRNFMYFLRDLFNWGKSLYDNNFTDEACTVLEYLISISNDNSSAFTILGRIYSSNDEIDKITKLINIVEQTPDSLSKKSALTSLRNIINSY